MARILARLGRACARRAPLVIATWVLLLAMAGGAFAVWGGTLSSSFSLPGTPTARTTELLRAALPQASGGAGSVVHATRDGSPFTAAQREAISTGLQRAAEVPGVTGVVDPFASEQQRAGRAAQLEQGQAQLAPQLTQLEAARSRLQAAADAGRGDSAALAAVEGQLAQARARQVQIGQGQTLLGLAERYRAVSADGSAALGTVTFPQAVQEVPQETRTAVIKALEARPIKGVDVDVTSDLVGTSSTVGAGEVVGLAVAAVVLFVVLGTVVGASVPLVGAVVGVWCRR